jgi:hypothetical protein
MATKTKTSRKAGALPASVLSTTKLDQIAALLAQTNGAGIAEMMAATGWQAHSVRGAMAGSLRRRGLIITSEKINSGRRYRGGTEQ